MVFLPLANSVPDYTRKFTNLWSQLCRGKFTVKIMFLSSFSLCSFLFFILSSTAVNRGKSSMTMLDPWPEKGERVSIRWSMETWRGLPLDPSRRYFT